MQLTPSHLNIVEKILRDKNGHLVRATFRVYENGGRIKARLISAIVLEEVPTIENKNFALPGIIAQSIPQFTAFIKNAIVSPYFNSNLLYSLGSKPRAPTYTN